MRAAGSKTSPNARLDRLTFLGAIGQPSSGAKYARLGLPPMLTGHSPLAAQRGILTAWDDTTRELGGDSDAPKVGSSILVMANTDGEAEALTRRYVPRWYQLQVKHYAFDAERHANVPGYQPFHETHKRRMLLPRSRQSRAADRGLDDWQRRDGAGQNARAARCRLQLRDPDPVDSQRPAALRQATSLIWLKLVAVVVPYFPNSCCVAALL